MSIDVRPNHRLIGVNPYARETLDQSRRLAKFGYVDTTIDVVLNSQSGRQFL